MDPDNQQAHSGIESVHRGFLYQHLYVVGCILLGRSNSEVLEVVTERDEDAEVIRKDEHWYLQIKTRTTKLQLADVSAALERFVRLAVEHARSERPRTPRFFIVCNAEVSDRIREDPRVLSLDVQLIIPSKTHAASLALPPAWHTIDEGLTWCGAQANAIPQTRLEPATLVWKLATEVALGSAGERPEGHSFDTSALDELFELFFRRIQTLPPPPAAYHTLEPEPDLRTSERVRLLIGLSGSGKTGWVAHRALHVSELLVYFDVGDNTDGSVASSLVREVAGALAESGHERDLRTALYAGATGLTALKAIDGLLRAAGLHPTLVIDNAHRISPGRVHEIVASLGAADWILLAQPWPGLAELRSRLNVADEGLGGMRVDGIAAEFRERGLEITIADADRLRRLTGGLPLFVRDAALLSGRQFSGDTHALCDALEERATTETSAQEFVLQTSIEHMNGAAGRGAAALACSDAPLSEAEALHLLTGSLGLSEAEARGALRDLASWGIVQILAHRTVLVHDAFRQALRGSALLTSTDADRVLRVLADVFRTSISSRTPERFLAYCRIAPRIGMTDVVVDLVGTIPEHLHEHGTAEALHRIIAAAANDPTLSVEDRFWASDTLAFWDIQRGADAETVKRDLMRLDEHLKAVADKPRARLTVATKRLMVAGVSGDCGEVRRLYGAAAADARGDRSRWLILRYIYGLALWKCGDPAADLVTRSVVQEHLAFIGLMPRQLFMTNPPELKELLGARGADVDDIKHVADAIDLRSRVVAETGGAVALLKLWAFKLYALANAPLSAIRMGKDVVDELLGIGAVQEALQFIEKTLIPGTIEQKLVEELIPLRAQYAVVLAYAGRADAARKELNDISVFGSTSELAARELENQRDLVERIARGEYRLRPTRDRNLDDNGLLMDGRQITVGRNESCPCGAGLKYKHCCGR